mmetsp:Transcript_8859/g.11781  ORF Transcript_8859/g.11781 Transcript_8859/m.11781 type:complete len:447 (-) Transcript_8859:95-1435(-)
MKLFSLQWLVAVVSATAWMLPLAVNGFAPSAFFFRHNNKHDTTHSSKRIRSAFSLNAVFNDPLAAPIDGNGDSRAGAVTKKKQALKPFARYLEVECWKNADLRELEPVLRAVANACKQINRIVQRAQTDDIYGAAVDAQGKVLTETNIQGEVQQKLDVLCNELFMRAFCGASQGQIHAVASEEEDIPRCCSDVMNDQAFAVGEFVAVFDPLDGSKNIDASLPVGSIFGIYRPPPGTKIGSDAKAFLHDGSSTLVASGYCLYSATTVLVLTMGSGVDGFTLDPDTGQFLHTHRDIRIPSSGPIYSFNEANYRDFDQPVRRYLTSIKEQSRAVGKEDGTVPLSARYIGALVADAHNVLINGGIYGYPATFQNRNGKLRLMYESNPMAMIMEQAGGAGSTGYGRILNVKPNDIHQRVPTFLGSIENVYELDQFCKYYSEEDEDQQRWEA